MYRVVQRWHACLPLLDGSKIHATHARRLDDLGRVHRAAAHAERPLVHVEKSTDAVAGAMEVVHPVLPQWPARKHLEHDAWRAGWEDGPGKRDVALKHACVRAPLVLGRGLRAEVEGAPVAPGIRTPVIGFRGVRIRQPRFESRQRT